MTNRHYTLYTSQLMSLLGFPIDNISEMDDSCTFHPDMDIDRFKRAICGTWTTQKASQIKHPALRYIQRVLAHTLFGRGETQSIMHRSVFFYLYCMLRRNEEEMYYMPHIGDHLAKHFEHVANSTKLNGTISCGGIITKLATALRIDLTQEDEAPGPIYMDLVALLNMRLILRTTDLEGYISKGPGKHGYNLPLTVDMINPLAQTTWRLANEPRINLAEDHEQEPQEGQAQAQPQAQPQGPSNQELMDYMVQQFGSFHDQFRTLNQRMDNVERDAQMAHYYAQMTFQTQGVEPSDPPPTPYEERRQRRNRRTGHQGGGAS